MTDVIRQEPVAPATGIVPASVARAPRDSGERVLGRTLVSLLDEAVERNPNPEAFHQLRGGRWQAMSTIEFRERAEALALGLRSLGLVKGDRVAFFASSDVSFTLPDMACLMGGLVTVPIYLTHSARNVAHIIGESEARALVVSNSELLSRIAEHLPGSAVRTVIVMEGGPGGPAAGSVDTIGAEELERRGRHAAELELGAASSLRHALAASDLATIIYTSGTTGLPKGVMLSHENISSNAIAAFTGLTAYRRGGEEVVLSFLPLTHIFARTLQYGCMWYGNTVYYSDPDSVREHFRQVRPTMIATVPRVLEKAYERIIDAGSQLHGPKRRIFDWSLALARRHHVERQPQGLEKLQLRVADRLVLSKWREALGGRMRYIIVGAAALRPELVNLFGAAGMDVLQGYGLTETSPVVSYNRPGANRPGSVGRPIAGVEVGLGDRNEILVRGPNVMKGYFRREEETERVLQGGWLRTGDVGEIDADGYLFLTGRVKNLFKLSTGKYVMPQPIEQQLEAEPLIEHALVVGEGEKYCGALLFMNPEALVAFGERQGLAGDEAELLRHQAVQAQILTALRRANEGLPGWSCVKRAVLALGEITIANDLLTPTLKLRREPVMESYRVALEALYRPSGELPMEAVAIEIPAG